MKLLKALSALILVLMGVSYNANALRHFTRRLLWQYRFLMRLS